MATTDRTGAGGQVGEHDRDAAPVGEMLRELRRRGGFRLVDVAELTGVSVAFVSLVETGKLAPSARFLVALERAMAGIVAVDAAAIFARLAVEEVERERLYSGAPRPPKVKPPRRVA